MNKEGQCVPHSTEASGESCSPTSAPGDHPDLYIPEPPSSSPFSLSALMNTLPNEKTTIE